ncbi:hypothetical protein LguiA_021350 [Lonicera macranthoides]
MASTLVKLVLFIYSIFATSFMVQASDRDILTDFVLPPNTTLVDGNFFTFTGLREVISNPPTSPVYKGTQASMAEFPALMGQGVSLAVLQFPAGFINPPHTRPRSAGLLFLLEGSLEVGLIDTTNKLYTQTLQAGDMFLFPKGLVHYQYNPSTDTPALAVATFGCANGGSVSVPAAVFGGGVDDGVLADSFKTDVATIQKIKVGLGQKD